MAELKTNGTGCYIAYRTRGKRWRVGYFNPEGEFLIDSHLNEKNTFTSLLRCHAFCTEQNERLAKEEER